MIVFLFNSKFLKPPSESNTPQVSSFYLFYFCEQCSHCDTFQNLCHKISYNSAAQICLRPYNALPQPIYFLFFPFLHEKHTLYIRVEKLHLHEKHTLHTFYPESKWLTHYLEVVYCLNIRYYLHYAIQLHLYSSFFYHTSMFINFNILKLMVLIFAYLLWDIVVGRKDP